MMADGRDKKSYNEKKKNLGRKYEKEKHYCLEENLKCMWGGEVG